MTDEEGNEVWERTYDIRDWDCVHGIVGTDDGGFIIAGETRARDEKACVYLLAVDLSGKLLWDRTFAVADEDSAAFVVANGEDFLVGGWSLEDHSCNPCLLGIGGGGVLLWQTTYGDLHWRGFGKGWYWPSCVVPDGEGGFVLSGEVEPPESWVGGNVYVLKVDGHGGKIWESSWEPDGYAQIEGIERAGDGFVVAGHLGWDGKQIYLARFREIVSEPILESGLLAAICLMAARALRLIRGVRRRLGRVIQAFPQAGSTAR
jgi:hypothetical protein